MTICSKTQFLPTLPVIDFSVPNLKPKTPEWESVKSQVRKALEEYGCFEALFDGASVELRKALFKASEEVFDLPLETKLSSESEKFSHGYEVQPKLPLYEGMGFNGVEDRETVEDVTRKLWPQGNVAFSNTVHSFAEKLIELSLKVRRVIMESFGLEKYVEEHLNSTYNHFHLFKYKGLEDNTGEKIGLDTHIDRQFVNILCQNDVEDGVEINTKDGEEWFKAKASQDYSFLVIAGASLHILLNGEVFPPLHRVVISGKKDRYSAGLFLRPKAGVIINAPEEIVDKEHPRLYKPFVLETFLKASSTNAKRIDLPNLKTYCAL